MYGKAGIEYSLSTLIGILAGLPPHSSSLCISRFDTREVGALAWCARRRGRAISDLMSSGICDVG